MTNADSSDGFWILTVGALVVLLWLPHAYYATRYWRRERTALAFRAFFIAVMLEVGLLRGVLAGAARLWPQVEVVQVANRALAPIIFLFLLTGAIIAYVTWRHAERRW